MPNQQQIRRVTEEERIKLGSLQEESRFYAADMSLEKNEMYRNIDRYNNVEKVAQDAAFAEEMLQLPSTAELNLTAEERGSLTMNLNRKQNFLLLNDGKFTGDSTEMQRVKAELGNLETLLGEHGVLNFKELTELDQAYRNAYKACQDYVNNKNPWFPTGKRRLEKVKATMKRLVQEQRCLAAGAEMLQKGLIDKEQIKTPYDLIQSEMTQNLDLQEKKEKYAKKCEQDQAVSDQWLPDFFEAMGIDEYLKEAQKVNPLITKEDAKWHMFREFEHYITSYSPVDLIEKDGKKEIVEKPAENKKVFPPIFKEFGLAGSLEKKGLMLDATTVGSASREIAPCIYFIKRDKQGNPLNQEEVQKDAYNKKWLGDFDAYFEAKGKVVAKEKEASEAEAKNEAAKKAAAEEELIKLREEEKAAADKIFNNFVERVEKAANTIVLPDAEEIKKDPSLVEKLVYRNIDEFLFLLSMPGQWSQLQRHVAPEQLIQYRKDHPKIVEFMSNASLLYPAFLEKRMDHVHHYAKDRKRNLLSDRAGELENLKKTGASEDEIRDMQDMVNEEETSFQELQKESLESYADQAVYMKENHASSFLNKDTSVYKWKMDTQLRMKIRDDIKSRKEEGQSAEWLQTEVMEGLKNAGKTLDQDYAKKDAFGPAGGLLYFPKHKDLSPFDEQDEKRAEWNQKWINYLKGNKAEEKKNMMREGMERVLSYQLPSPAQITERGILSVINEDPFHYAQMMHNVSCFEKLKDVDAALFGEIMPAGSLKEKKYRMMEKFTSWLKKALFVHGIEQDAEGKWTYAAKNATAEDKKEAQRLREEYEQNYLEVMDEDSLEKVKQGVLTDAYLDEKLKEAKKQDPKATKETVYLAEAYRICEKQRDEALSGINKRAVKLKLIDSGLITRLLTAGFYYIKKDANGNPANEEEKRKAEHNKLWVDALTRWVDSKDPEKIKDPAAAAAEEKKARRDIMSAVFRVWNEQMKKGLPDPEAMKNPEDLREFVLKDPFQYYNIHAHTPCEDKLRLYFPEDTKNLKKELPGFENYKNLVGLLGGQQHIITHYYGLDGELNPTPQFRYNDKDIENQENDIYKMLIESEYKDNYANLKKAQGKESEIPPQPEQVVIHDMEAHVENQQVENKQEEIKQQNNQQIQSEQKKEQGNKEEVKGEQKEENIKKEDVKNVQKEEIKEPVSTDKNLVMQQKKLKRIQKNQEEIEKKGEFQRYYKEVESTPEAMDKQLVEIQDQEKFKGFEESELATLDKTKIWVQPKLKDYVWKYTGGSYKKYNKALRQNAEEGEETDLDGALKLKEGLKKCTINRNIVVRREVRGLDTLANMLGLKIDPKQKDYADKLKDAIKGKIGEQKDKDVVLTDPGFVSTTYSPGSTYLSQGDGVEFIINVKKGTQAMNISACSQFPEENEILLNAGTKFKLVKVFYNGCSGEEEMPLCEEQYEGKKKYSYTDRKVWKVYLETIPSNGEGQLK